MSTAAIRLIIVDDHPLVREGIRGALSSPGFALCADVGTAEAALAAIRTHAPDVVVMDITLPDRSGIALTEQVRREHPAVRILMLSVHDHPEYVLESARAGAHGYLRKDSLPDELRAAIRRIHEGQTAFQGGRREPSDSAAPVLSAAADRVDLLTRRERDVLVGIAAGKSNKEIAGDLSLSVRTVESYRETLMAKLGIRTTAGLTRFAIEAGLP